MQITIGAVVAASLLLACSGGVLDVGSNDGGAICEDIPVPEAGTEASEFSAAAVDRAREVCSLVKNDAAVFTQILSAALPTVEYSPAKLRSDLNGGWLVCIHENSADALSFRFTADGRWYVLADDGDGGLKRSRSCASAVVIRGYDAGATPYEGAYTFQEVSYRPVSSDVVDLVAAGGAPWFRPTFLTLMGGQRLIAMDFNTDPSLNINVFVGP